MALNLVQRRSKLLDIGKAIVTTPITAPNRKYIISYHITVIDSSVLSVLFFNHIELWYIIMLKYVMKKLIMITCLIESIKCDNLFKRKYQMITCLTNNNLFKRKYQMITCLIESTKMITCLRGSTK